MGGWMWTWAMRWSLFSSRLSTGIIGPEDAQERRDFTATDSFTNDKLEMTRAIYLSLFSNGLIGPDAKSTKLVIKFLVRLGGKKNQNV